MYLTMQVPGMESPRFTLSSSFIPREGQNVLTGFLAVDPETGDTAGNPAESYGDMTLLRLPASNPVNGPGQVQATFNSEPNVSQALNLLQQGASEVINGNLLTLPVGEGLLYVQPVYLQSSASGGAPSTRCCRWCWSPSVTRSVSPPPWTRLSTWSSAVTPARRPVTPRSRTPMVSPARPIPRPVRALSREKARRSRPRRSPPKKRRPRRPLPRTALPRSGWIRP